MNYISLSHSDFKKVAQEFAATITSPCCVALWGDLGAGKTTFCQTVIKSLMNDENITVTSPTFTLVQHYNADKGEIWHVDLYRLKLPEEIEEIGLLEAIKHNICLIEWPERLDNMLPKKRIDVRISIEPDQT